MLPNNKIKNNRSSNITLEMGSQANTFGDHPRIKNGACAGFTLRMIDEELQARELKAPYNPLKNKNDTLPFDIQDFGAKNNYQYWKFFDDNQVDKKRAPYTVKPDQVYHKHLNDTLKQTIEDAKIDNVAHGISIGVCFNSPEISSDSHSENVVCHMLGMTARTFAGKLRCLGFDSNTLFAMGNNVQGCKEVASQVSAITSRYEPVQTLDLEHITCHQEKNKFKK